MLCCRSKSLLILLYNSICMGTRKGEKEKLIFKNMLICRTVKLKPKSAASFAKLTFIDAEQTITDAKATLCTKLTQGCLQNVSGEIEL